MPKTGKVERESGGDWLCWHSVDTNQLLWLLIHPICRNSCAVTKATCCNACNPITLPDFIWTRERTFQFHFVLQFQKMRSQSQWFVWTLLPSDLIWFCFDVQRWWIVVHILINVVLNLSLAVHIKPWLSATSLWHNEPRRVPSLETLFGSRGHIYLLVWSVVFVVRASGCRRSSTFKGLIIHPHKMFSPRVSSRFFCVGDTNVSVLARTSSESTLMFIQHTVQSCHVINLTQS